MRTILDSIKLKTYSGTHPMTHTPLRFLRHQIGRLGSADQSDAWETWWRWLTHSTQVSQASDWTAGISRPIRCLRNLMTVTHTLHSGFSGIRLASWNQPANQMPENPVWSVSHHFRTWTVPLYKQFRYDNYFTLQLVFTLCSPHPFSLWLLKFSKALYIFKF